jgi:hypothetical protein
VSDEYCYNDKCPARTEKEPWPRSDCKNGWVKVISRNGKSYKKRALVCNHCGQEMTATFSMFDEDLDERRARPAVRGE